MSTLRRVVSEPFFQFLVIGAAIFVLYAALRERSGEAEPETIVVSTGQVAQIYEIFSRTWQRPPTAEELRSLVDAHVKEEIFYREGRKLGLDENDTVFRRRLQQKMEFLMEPSAAELTPKEGELETYLDANREKFRIPARLAFEQVFLSPDRRGDAVLPDAEEVLTALRQAGNASDTAGLGDPTMLPPRMALAPLDQIERNFGSEFAEGLLAAPAGEWAGPIRSTFGVHLVRVDEKAEARDPPLSDVIDVVTREWEAGRRREIADARYAEMREGYTVVLEMPEAEADPSDAAEAAGNAGSRVSR